MPGEVALVQQPGKSCPTDFPLVVQIAQRFFVDLAAAFQEDPGQQNGHLDHRGC